MLVHFDNFILHVVDPVGETSLERAKLYITGLHV